MTADTPEARTLGEEPVAWQWRVMFDKGSKREAKWCSWHDTSEINYRRASKEIAEGNNRLQARALYAAPPARASSSHEALRTALEREEKYLLEHFDDECGIMPGDVQGSFHRISEALSDTERQPDRAGVSQVSRPHSGGAA